MKHLLFVLLSAACFDSTPDNDEPEEESENDRREGEREGDCTDGEDNDDDGDIDCDDSGCSDKPACEGVESGDVEIADFYGVSRMSFLYNSGEECIVTYRIDPVFDEEDVPSLCDDCIVYGQATFEGTNNCGAEDDSTSTEWLAINALDERLFYFNAEDNEWIPWMMLSICNDGYTESISGSIYSGACSSEQEEYYFTEEIELEWL